MNRRSGELSWPWLRAPLKEVLASSRAQALLVQGAPGMGTLEFSLALGQAWLCEAATASPRHHACGHCDSCRMVEAKTHPDLHVRLPEEMALGLGWPQRHDDKRKPSRQIRMEDIREALDWIVTTPGRGMAKVLVVHPADVMNPFAASALLKTLEEPPAQARIILSATDPSRLLPTILSRVQRWVLPAPTREVARAWLENQGVSDADHLLAATSQAPLEALRMFHEGLTGPVWNRIPQALEQGSAAPFDRWPVPRVVDALLKVCHDAVVKALAAPSSVPPSATLFFPEWKSAPASLSALEQWRRNLGRVAVHADHPWQEALLLESLVSEAQAALKTSASGSR